MTEGGSEGKKEGSEVDVFRMNNSACREGPSIGHFTIDLLQGNHQEGKQKGFPPNNDELHP